MLTTYRIVDFAKLHHSSHIIWDIDGTITDETGQVSNEVAAKIINLALDGVYHSFITGRDANWIVTKVIDPMKRFYNFARVRDNLVFFAEVGCQVVNVDSSGNVEIKVHPAVKDHPLYADEKGIRETLKKLVHNPKVLKPYKREVEVRPPFDVVYDANEEGWLVNCSQPSPECHHYVWSTTKVVFGTFEKIRNEEGKCKTFDQTPFEERTKRVIEEAGFSDSIDVEVVSTAINIVPKVNGKKLGKSWAAGQALENIQKSKLGGTVLLDEVVAKTIAFGDGKADFDFTVPTFSAEVNTSLKIKDLQIVFVGGEQDLPAIGSPEKKLQQNIIMQATGRGDLSFDWTKDVIYLQPAKGARVVSDVLDFLRQWGYFRPF